MSTELQDGPDLTDEQSKKKPHNVDQVGPVAAVNDHTWETAKDFQKFLERNDNGDELPPFED